MTSNNQQQQNNNSNDHQHTNHMEREEGVLKDVLEELDRERSRRAELEDHIRKLQEEKELLLEATETNNRTADDDDETPPKHVSDREYVSMETQVQSYQQLVDVLTLGKPAIAAAAAAEEAATRRKKQSSSHPSKSTLSPHQQRQQELHHGKKKRTTLPVHVVRLLEVLPWDPRTRQHIFGIEEVFEWQVWKEGRWQSHIKYFPTMFKNLRVVKPAASSSSNKKKQLLPDATQTSRNNTAESTEGGPADSSSRSPKTSPKQRKEKDRSLLFFLAGGENQTSSARKSSSNTSRILTNLRVTALYDIMDGAYPLPQDGGVWEWVGGWRTSKRNSSNDIADDYERVDCDQEGWSYVVEPEDYLLGLNDMIWDNALIDEENGNKPKRPYRRRRWVRQRVLVDYLYASKSTQQYLKMVCENTRLSITAGKIGDQLVETKTALTDAEEKLMETRDLLKQREAQLEASGIIIDTIKEDDDGDSDVVAETDDKDGVRRKSDNNSAARSTPGKTDFGSKLTQWVQSARKTSEDLTSADESVEDNSNSIHNIIEESSSSSDALQPQQMDGSNKFGWKKLGRGQLMNKLKNQGGNKEASSSSAHMKKTGSARNIFRARAGSASSLEATTKSPVKTTKS